MTKTHPYTLRDVEAGVFLAEPSDGWQAFRRVHLPGLPLVNLMYWRMTVSDVLAQEDHDHLILMTHCPLVDWEVCEGIARLLKQRYASARLSFVRSLLGQRVELASDSEACETAAAVGEVVRAGTLDDVDSVSVTVGSTHFKVAVGWSGGQAHSAVTEAG